MNKQDQIAELQKKYGRKELSFGCEISLCGNKDTVVRIVKQQRCSFWLNDGAGDELVKFDRSKDDEILGHPLCLADILAAIEDRYGRMFIDTRGGLYSRNDTDNTLVFIAKLDWNLSHNLLRDQSDEVVDSVFKILFPDQA